MPHVGDDPGSYPGALPDAPTPEAATIISALDVGIKQIRMIIAGDISVISNVPRIFIDKR